MRSHKRLTILVFLLAFALPACALSPDDKPANQQSIAALEARINQAPPREQCYLYAQLIHQMTEFSLHQYSAGDVQTASQLLKRVQAAAQSLHLSMKENDKRIKNAEILLRRSAFRLTEMLHASSYEDRPLVESALAQVNRADNEAMMHVLQK